MRHQPSFSHQVWTVYPSNLELPGGTPDDLVCCLGLRASVPSIPWGWRCPGALWPSGRKWNWAIYLFESDSWILGGYFVRWCLLSRDKKEKEKYVLKTFGNDRWLWVSQHCLCWWSGTLWCQIISRDNAVSYITPCIVPLVHIQLKVQTFLTQYFSRNSHLRHSIVWLACWVKIWSVLCGFTVWNIVTGRDRLRLTALTTNHHGGGANREFWKTLVYTSDAHVQWNTCDRWTSSYHDGIYFDSEEL